MFPPIDARTAGGSRGSLVASSDPAARVAAIYVHIPFCHTICPFCAFAVHGSRPQLHEPFVDSLVRELKLAQLAPQPEAVRSIYFGGGTPSTLSPAHVERIRDALGGYFHFSDDAEIAFEINPEDATVVYLQALRRLGITRISLGVQSLSDETLQALGRNHTARQAATAYDAALAVGFDNVNVDLMFGAPEMPAASFRRDVEAIAAWRPAHVSLYGLDIEERTLFGRNARIRAWASAHREDQAAQYERAAATLSAAGYDHYEVSNFSLPGRAGRQNLLVWGGAGYLGFGPGAHSHVAGRRWANVRHLSAYRERIAHGERPIAFAERLTPSQAADEALMLALRQRAGLDVRAWEVRHDRAWGMARTRTCEALARRGLAKWEHGRLRLLPRGLLLADEITARLAGE